MMIANNIIVDKLNLMYPDARCELQYNRDYELLIATVLSAQCTDKRVNMVTKELFQKYDIFSLAKANKQDIEKIIRPVGTYTKKSEYILNIAKSLVKDYEGHVPNNRQYLENLAGVGRKTCNVVLANLFNEPTIAVDTHVSRVAKRLKLARKNDNVDVIERKLMKYLPKEVWSRFHHQAVLFGRYTCKARNPLCSECLLKDYCQSKDKTCK